MNPHLTLCCLGALVALAILAGHATAQEQEYTPHPYISIGSNNGFLLPTSGVTAGSGTPEDPYIISGWDIRQDPYVTTNFPAIAISGTNAHVIIENVRIAEAREEGILISGGASNIVVRNVTTTASPAVWIIENAHHITIGPLSTNGKSIFDIRDAGPVFIHGLNPSGPPEVYAWDSEEITVDTSSWPTTPDACLKVQMVRTTGTVTDTTGLPKCLSIYANEAKGLRLEGLYAKNGDLDLGGKGESTLTVENVTYEAQHLRLQGWQEVAVKDFTFRNGTMRVWGGSSTFDRLVMEPGAAWLEFQGGQDIHISDSRILGPTSNIGFSVRDGNKLHAVIEDTTFNLASAGQDGASIPVGGYGTAASRPTLELRNVTMQGHIGHGVAVDGPWTLIVRNSTIRDALGDGVWSEGGVRVEVTDTQIHRPTRRGIYAEQTASIILGNVEILDAGSDGVRVVPVGYVRIENTTVKGSQGNGFHIQAATTAIIRDSTATDNPLQGFSVLAWDRLIGTGNQALRNGRSGFDIASDHVTWSDFTATGNGCNGVSTIALNKESSLSRGTVSDNDATAIILHGGKWTYGAITSSGNRDNALWYTNQSLPPVKVEEPAPTAQHAALEGLWDERGCFTGKVLPPRPTPTPSPTTTTPTTTQDAPPTPLLLALLAVVAAVAAVRPRRPA